MKAVLLVTATFSIALSSCTTLENRRDMYCGYRKVYGPYTRMLKEGIPATETTSVAVTSEGKGVVVGK